MAIVTDFDFVQIVQSNEEGIISRTDFAQWVRDNVPMAEGGECCVGPAIVARGADAYDVYTTVCADPNVEPVGAVGSFLLDVTDSRIDLYKSDGAEWEIVPKAEIRDQAYVNCSNNDDGYVYSLDTLTWTQGDQPAQVDPGNPDSWPLAQDPYEFQPVVDANGYMLGYVDQSAAHPIGCEIGDPIVIDGSSIDLGPVLTGICDDPNTAPVTSEGDYLLDITVSPFNLFESDGTQWELIPRSTIADKTQFNCVNIPDQYLFDAPSMTWAAGTQPVAVSVTDPSTWGTVTAPVKKRCVYNAAGELIGMVDKNGGHRIATAQGIIGSASPSGAPTPDASGLISPFYVQTGVSDSRTGQNDLTILWYWNGSAWERINHLVVPLATSAQRGIVELATDAETQAGTDNERAVTPAGLRTVHATEAARGLIELATQAEAIAGTDAERAITPATLQAVINTLDDMHAVGWNGYDASTNTLTLRMDDGTLLPVNLTSLINDAINTLPYATDTAPGKIRIATGAEVDAGTSNVVVITPAALKNKLDSVACDEPVVATAAELADPNNFQVLGCVGGEQKKINGADLIPTTADADWDPLNNSGPTVRRLAGGPNLLTARAGAPGGGLSASVPVPNGVTHLLVSELYAYNNGDSDEESPLWLLPVTPGQTLTATHNDADRSVTVSNGVWSYMVRASTIYDAPQAVGAYSAPLFSVINTANYAGPRSGGVQNVVGAGQAISGENNTIPFGFGDIYAEIDGSNSSTRQSLWWATQIG